MDIKALLEQSKAQYQALEEKYAALESTIAKLTEAGEKNLEDNQVFIDMKNEIADLEERVKAGVHQKSDDGKTVRGVANVVIGKFIRQAHALKTEGGEEPKGFDHFVKMEMKVLNITNTGEGAEAIAEVLSRQIVERAREAYPILGEIGRRQMPRDLREQVLISYPSVQEGIENVAGIDIPETTTQKYGEVKNRVAKLNAKPRITDEAMFAPDIDIYANLQSLLDDEIGRYLLMQCLYGNGTGKNMRGILSSNRFSLVEGVKPTFDSATPEDARDLDHFPIYKTGVAGGLPATDVAKADFLVDVTSEALPTKYLQGAKWYMTRKTAAIFRKCRDANGLKLLTQADGGKGLSLEGYPVVLDDNLPEMVANAGFIIFGQLSQAFTISNGDIKKMLLDPYSVDGCTLVKIDQEYFEMVGKNDAIVIITAVV